MALPPSRLLGRVRPVYKPLYFLISLNGKKKSDFLSFFLTQNTESIQPPEKIQPYSQCTPLRGKDIFSPYEWYLDPPSLLLPLS